MPTGTLYFPTPEWCAGKCLTVCSLEKKTLIRSISWSPWCRHSHHGRFQAVTMRSLYKEEMYSVRRKERALGSDTRQARPPSIIHHDSTRQEQYTLDHTPHIHLITDPRLLYWSGKCQWTSTFLSSCSPPTSGCLRAGLRTPTRPQRLMTILWTDTSPLLATAGLTYPGHGLSPRTPHLQQLRLHP